MKNKKILVGLILFVTVLSGCSKKEDTKLDVVSKDEYVGTWYWHSGRPIVNIVNEINDTFDVVVNWGSSATENSIWNYKCEYNNETGNLDCNGSRANVIYKDSENKDVNIVYEDGKATFILKDGKMTWEDQKEDAGKDVVLEKNDELN